MDEDTVARWLAAYGRAWETHDGVAAATLFTEDGVYCWGPFETPLVGHDAIRSRWQAATAQHGEVHFQAAAAGRDGDRAFARWQVSLRPAGSSTPIELDGVFVLDFASDGRCARLQEWWMNRPAAS